MTDLESHPLNKAHQQYRRADAHLRYKRFEEAIQCHQNAAELLLDAMKSTTYPFAIESLSIQHSYHLRQKDLIKHKQEQYERVKKTLDHLKQISTDPYSELAESESKIQIDIYRNLNETDTLIGALISPKSSNNDDVDGDLTKTNVEEKIKSQNVVKEEIHTLNKSLHSLVDRLVMQIELAKDENVFLRDKVQYLEEERKKYLNIQDSNRNAFQVVTDSGNDYANTLSAFPTDIITGRPVQMDSDIRNS